MQAAPGRPRWFLHRGRIKNSPVQGGLQALLFTMTIIWIPVSCFPIIFSYLSASVLFKEWFLWKYKLYTSGFMSQLLLYSLCSLCHVSPGHAWQVTTSDLHICWFPQPQTFSQASAELIFFNFQFRSLMGLLWGTYLKPYGSPHRLSLSLLYSFSPQQGDLQREPLWTVVWLLQSWPLHSRLAHRWCSKRNMCWTKFYKLWRKFPW